MREIKFRAWRKDEQRMYSIGSLSFMTYSDGTPENRGCEGWWGDNHRDRFSLAEVVLMQYTGLKDKNGKEIYEGDIDKNHGEIEFRHGVYRMGVKNANIIILGVDISQADTEIIGNIYENPELINQ